MTTTRLKGTLFGKSGHLYVTVGERRLLLARCEPEIRIYEKATQVNARGVIGHWEKKRYCSIVICADKDVFQEVNDDFIRKVTGVELVFDIQNQNAITETIKITGLATDDLDYCGVWEFEADLLPALADKLLSLL